MSGRLVNKASDALCRRLDYRFNDPALLARALTHRSKGGDHNERLEFLGDAVINLVIAAELYQRFPDLPEGDLTRLRASLVRKPALAALARTAELGQYIELGGGELKSGGYDRDSILADTLEAVFGAIYLDGGLEPLTRVALSLYRTDLTRLDPSVIPKDPKTKLQEYLQKHSLPTPNYDVVEISGEAHQQNFVVTCHVVSLPQAVRGEGNSRRAAEQQAAERALVLLDATS
jgi:ribonuclease-3